MIRPGQLLSLIAAGIVLAGAGVWLLSRRGDLEAQGPVLPLKQADLNAVARVRIFKGDGSHTTLSRTSTGWIVTERDYPADTGQVRKLLLDLSALQIEELKTTDARLYAKLGVEDPIRVQATSTGLEIDVNGKTLGLVVGRTSGTRSGYVRVAGAMQSLLATPQLAPDADPRHWLDRTLLDIAPEQITEVDVTPQAGPAYTVKRSAAGVAPEFAISPIPKGRSLAEAGAAAAQAGALAGLQLDDVRKSAARSNLARARFQTREGLEIAIEGIQDGERRYLTVVAAGSTPALQQRVRDLNARLAGWEFEVPGYRYDALFRPLEQLLKPLSSAPAAGSAKPLMSPVATPQQSH